MIQIGLDLAFKTCGIAIVEGNEILYLDSYIITHKEPELVIQKEMTNKIFNKIKDFFKHKHTLILEDTFRGKKFEILKMIARTQGAITDRYINLQNKYPEFVTAVNARNRVGINPELPKAGIQLWVLDRFNLKSTLSIKYKSMIQNDINKYLNSKLVDKGSKKVKLKAKLENHSLRIYEITGIDNHMADALVLALGGVKWAI